MGKSRCTNTLQSAGLAPQATSQTGPADVCLWPVSSQLDLGLQIWFLIHPRISNVVSEAASPIFSSPAAIRPVLPGLRLCCFALIPVVASWGPPLVPFVIHLSSVIAQEQNYCVLSLSRFAPSSLFAHQTPHPVRRNLAKIQSRQRQYCKHDGAIEKAQNSKNKYPRAKVHFFGTNFPRVGIRIAALEATP